MPLDTALKIAHVQAVINRTYSGRQKTVVFVYQNTGGGGYTYTAVTNTIFRSRSQVDPQIPNIYGVEPMLVWDTLMIAPLATNFTGVVYVADTSTATAGGVAAAQKYEIVECVTNGILPAGTHYEVKMRRLR